MELEGEIEASLLHRYVIRIRGAERNPEKKRLILGNDEPLKCFFVVGPGGFGL